MALSVQHAITLLDPRAHLLAVETTVRSDAPLPEPLVLFMPVWTPGSYLIREYARHVESVTGLADGEPCSADKIRKNAWRVGRRGAREITLRYHLYCNELTVRTNHVDGSHAFLNGAPTFCAIEGHESLPSTVDVQMPDDWTVVSSLPRAPGSPPESRGRARFAAKDLDTLVDSPIEAGLLRIEKLSAKGVPHDLLLWPRARLTDAQVETLTKDVVKIIETEAAWFGGSLPYDRYLFLLHLTTRARGGLEHLTSSALLASPGAFSTRDGYLDVLSLFAHELFHAWNVKRIRPAGLAPTRWGEENYTRLLWWFEGATSYYDWRALRVAGLCSAEEYGDHLGSEIVALERQPGRLVQSLEQSSFDSWIKLYRPDENSDNSGISYYRKGEIVCAMLDLEIRARSSGAKSLDDVLLLLWEKHGRTGVPLPEDGAQPLFEEATGLALGDLFDAWIRRPGEVECGPTLAKVGLKLEREVRAAAESKPRPALGLRLRSDGGRAVVAAVVRGGAAMAAGVDPGDELVAVAGCRVEGPSLEGALSGKAPGDEVEVHVARDGRLLSLRLRLEEAGPDRLRIVRKSDASEAERLLGAAWLGS